MRHESPPSSHRGGSSIDTAAVSIRRVRPKAELVTLKLCGLEEAKESQGVERCGDGSRFGQEIALHSLEHNLGILMIHCVDLAPRALKELVHHTLI